MCVLRAALTGTALIWSAQVWYSMALFCCSCLFFACCHQIARLLFGSATQYHVRWQKSCWLHSTASAGLASAFVGTSLCLPFQVAVVSQHVLLITFEVLGISSGCQTLFTRTGLHYLAILFPL